jgi:hypothetical protein
LLSNEIIKKRKKILLILLVFLFIVAGLLSLLSYNSSFQTFAANTYLKSLAKKLNTAITVESVDVSLFEKVTLNNIYVEDLNNDTLLYAKNIEVDINDFSLNKKLITLDKATIRDTYFNLKKYKNDSTTNLQFIINHFKSSDTTKGKWVFGINDVVLENFRFNYINENKPVKPYGVDFNHLGLVEVNTKINNIKLIPKGVDCIISELSLLEKSGFKVDSFSVKGNVSPSGIITQNLKVKTPSSDIDGNVTFLTKNYKSLANFIEDVKIKSFFTSTKVDFKDISYFASALKGLDKWLNFEGEINGKINNLKTRKFSFVTDDGSRFRGKADISGLPNVQDMFMHVDVKEFITTKEKIETIPSYPFDSGKKLSLPKNFRHLGPVRFKGNFTGFYHDFVAYGKLKTSLGNVTTDVTLKLDNGNPRYKGKIKTDHFKLGRLFEMSKDLKDITMNINVDGKGFTKETLELDMSGEINQVVFKNYEYNNVDLKGLFKDEIFKGYVAVEDENITFDFDGEINLSKKVPEFHFLSNIENAKLGKLNLVKSKKKLKTRFSTQILVDLVGTNVDNLVGEIVLSDVRYNDKLDSLKLDEIYLKSSSNDKQRIIKVKSDLLDANIKGEFYAKEIVDFVNNFFVRYIPSQEDKTHKVVNLSHDLTFEVELHNSAMLSKVLFRGVKMSDHTIVSGNYNSQKHVLTINGDSPFMNAHGVKFDGFTFNSKANEEVLDLVVDAAKIYASDSLYVENFNISGVLERDSGLTELSWINHNDESRNEANFLINTIFDGYGKMTNSLINSYVYISDSLWTVKPNNSILTDSSFLHVKGLSIGTKSQNMLVDGKLSNDPADQVDMLLKNFDLHTFKKLIPENVIQLEGVVDGVASVREQDNDLLFTSDLSFKKFRINESLIGQGNVEVGWNTNSKSLKLDGKFYRDHIPSILFSGNYYPNNEEEKIDMNFKLNQAELSMFDAYTEKFISNLKGTANADVSLKGNFKKPKLSGLVTLQKTEFKVNYLNTTYKTNICNINVLPDMISFDNVVFTDENFSQAIANGTIYHEWFKDLSMDIGLDAKNFLALNTTELDNSLYYGKAFVSGLVNIGSYDKHMNIDVDVITEKNTVLNIPLSDNEDIEENNFIEFVSHKTDTIDVKLEEDVDLTNIEMNFDLEITPDAQVRLIFDDQIGDVMRSVGTGNVTLNINKDGELDMFGNYVVIDGDYLFTLQNVINKRFDLEEGGTISWNGSPYDAEIDLTAVYRLRARLYDLLVGVDTSDIYKKRIPVDLKLRMQNAMMNPDISFDIVLPTADEDTRNKVRSVLYVSDKEENTQELNKQVFSLLVLNTFLPPPGAEAGYGHANVGTTTSSELLSNQLSNWLSKISNDFDIGVNYRPGDELSNQELELALSTQLFNDRLILDGNFGISDRENVSSEAQSTNNLIGDISLEYKITKDGKLRAKAFNNSNQFSFQDVNSPYTQGLGLSYKEEFDTGKEFWNKLLSRFRRKNKKEDGTK